MAEKGRDMKQQWGHPMADVVTVLSAHQRGVHTPGGSDVAGNREENGRKSSQCHNSHRKGWLGTETRPSQIFLLHKGSLTRAVLCEGSKTKQRRSSLNKKPPNTSIKIKKAEKRISLCQRQQSSPQTRKLLSRYLITKPREAVLATGLTFEPQLKPCLSFNSFHNPIICPPRTEPR